MGEVGRIWKFSLIGVAVVLLMLTPLFLFDLKHDFLNVRGLVGIFSEEKGFGATEGATKVGKVDGSWGDYIWVSLKETQGRSMHIINDLGFADYYGAGPKNFLILGLGIYLVALAVKAGRRRGTEREQGNCLPAMILIMLVVSILGISFYRHSVYDHYILFAAPVVFLAFGLMLGDIWERGRWLGKAVAGLFIAVFLLMNFGNYDFRAQGTTIRDMEKISRSILEEVGEETRYNVISWEEGGDQYALNYRYFLTVLGNNPPTEPEEIGETERIVVIDEMADPLFDWRYSAIYEVVVFGARGWERAWRPLGAGGPMVYVLTR